MREILFRGKRVDGYGWIYGGLIYDEAEHNQPRIVIGREYSTGTFFNAQAPRVYYKTVGQFTGLTDKNGKKIFEGDIVRYTRTNMYAPSCSFHKQDLVSLHTIYWSNKEYRFEQSHYNLEEKRVIGYGGIIFNDDRAKENIIEVIGNIHDNPELLEVE